MSAGIDVLSAVATVISTLDVVIRAMKTLYDARERQMSLPRVLAAHRQELLNIRQILLVVRKEKILQVPTMLEDLEQLATHGRSLDLALQALSKERGPIKQYANQFFNGKRGLEGLADIMQSMDRAKANLSIKIQLVHIGLTHSVGDVVVVNCEMVEELDRKLQVLFGQGKGLRLAEMLQHRKRHRDGTVHLKDSDIASLSDTDSSTVVDEDGPGRTTSRMVERNEANDEALQLNAPIGIGGFVEVDHLVINDNKALKQSIQVNHAVSQDNFDKIMAARFGRLF